jgi:hypothetical protein
MVQKHHKLSSSIPWVLAMVDMLDLYRPAEEQIPTTQ